MFTITATVLERIAPKGIDEETRELHTKGLEHPKRMAKSTFEELIELLHSNKNGHKVHGAMAALKSIKAPVSEEMRQEIVRLLKSAPYMHVEGKGVIDRTHLSPDEMRKLRQPPKRPQRRDQRPQHRKKEEPVVAKVEAPVALVEVEFTLAQACKIAETAICARASLPLIMHYTKELGDLPNLSQRTFFALERALASAKSHPKAKDHYKDRIKALEMVLDAVPWVAVQGKGLLTKTAYAAILAEEEAKRQAEAEAARLKEEAEAAAKFVDELNNEVAPFCEKAAMGVWREMTGNATLTADQFKQKCDEQIAAAMQSHFQDRFSITPNTYFSFEAGEYGWNCEFTVSTIDEKSKGTFTVTARRESVTEEAA